MESELSPGYESDAESVAPSLHAHSLHNVPADSQTSQPMSMSKSMAPSSDDTVWERAQENATYKRRRRHSDGPFFLGRRVTTADPRFASPGTLESGRAPPSSSQLHPYVSFAH